MKVLYIGVFKADLEEAVQLASAINLEGTNRFTQTNYIQLTTFAAATVAGRTKAGERLVVDESDKGYKIFSVRHAAAGVCGVVMTDKEYPKPAAQSLSSKITYDFVNKYPRTAIDEFAKNRTSTTPLMSMPEFDDYLKRYQDPLQADSIAKIQKELDDTKEVLHKTIESTLQRGEKIDDLVAKSDNLSSTSKMFYTQAKKQNSCCNVM